MSRWKIKRCDHAPDAYMGRFGGGWQWKLGIQVGRSRNSVIVNLLTRAYRFDRVKT